MATAEVQTPVVAHPEQSVETLTKVEVVVEADVKEKPEKKIIDKSIPEPLPATEEQELNKPEEPVVLELEKPVDEKEATTEISEEKFVEPEKLEEEVKEKELTQDQLLQIAEKVVKEEVLLEKPAEVTVEKPPVLVEEEAYPVVVEERKE